MNMAFLWNNSSAYRILIVIAVIAVLYVLFISGLSTNPPGFYMDESCLSYNGYLIAHTGAGEMGKSFPLYFQCYTGEYLQFANPTHVYLLAAMYLFVPASTLSARILAATMVFISMLLLGVLAARISKRRGIGAIVALTGLATPWFFEVSRLVLETFAYPLCLVLFLLCVFAAYERIKWRIFDNISLALTLALVTYSYSIGRLLGPALAFGLLIFAVDKRDWLKVIKTWGFYLATLIPLFYVYFTNPQAIMRRLHEVSYLTSGKPWSVMGTQFVTGFFEDLSPDFLLFSGDTVGRHHVPVMGEVYVATFILAIVGLVLILIYHRKDPWWRFILYGVVISIVPGAITNDRHHSLRLLAFPVFFMILTVPALSWLIGKGTNVAMEENRRLAPRVSAGGIILVVLLIFTLAQAVFFQMRFRSWAPERQSAFNAAYPAVLDKALSQPDRPIYLLDGRFGPGYINALWYATIRRIDLSNFYHLAPGEAPPINSLVITSDSTCSNCDVILRKDQYLLYKTAPPGTYATADLSASDGDIRISPSVLIGKPGTEDGNFSKPHSIACDSSGNFYVADAGNSRVEKFDSAGTFLASFGVAGTGVGQLKVPGGVAIDESGSIYITDSANHKLLKLAPDGQFLKEWPGSPLGFYGPRDIAFGPNKQLYIIDQGRNRIVKFDPVTETFTAWGVAGTKDGEFSEPTGITIGADQVFVCEPNNQRIQVFDLDGKFVRQWLVAEWDKSPEQYPDAVFDNASSRICVSNPANKDVLMFDVKGNLKGRIRPMANEIMGNPAGMCITQGPGPRTLAVVDSDYSRVYLFSLYGTRK